MATTAHQHDVTMDAPQIMRVWRPGSYDEPWTWADEMADLLGRDGTAMADLLRSVASEGFREPVILGAKDRRVWDGHHRIIVGQLLNVPVPVAIL